MVVSTCSRGVSTRLLSLGLLLFLLLLLNPHLLLLLHRPKLVVGVFRTMFGVGKPALLLKFPTYLWRSFPPHLRENSRYDGLWKLRLSRGWKRYLLDIFLAEQDPCIVRTLNMVLLARDSPCTWHGSR